MSLNKAIFFKKKLTLLFVQNRLGAFLGSREGNQSTVAQLSELCVLSTVAGLENSKNAVQMSPVEFFNYPGPNQYHSLCLNLATKINMIAIQRQNTVG